MYNFHTKIFDLLLASTERQPGSSTISTSTNNIITEMKSTQLNYRTINSSNNTNNNNNNNNITIKHFKNNRNKKKT